MLLTVPKVGATSIRTAAATAGWPVGGEIPAGSRRVAIVRNTWDRIIACWLQKTHSEPRRVAQLRNGRFRFGMTLEVFLEVVASNPCGNMHYAPQDWIVGDHDEAVELSDLTVWWARTFPHQPLSHLNRTEGRDADHRVYYSDATRATVATIYASEIALWGFEFD